MKPAVLYPSWEDTEVLDQFFALGRTMWPDLDELRQLKIDRRAIDDEIVRFLRSTALNEYGIVHYMHTYFKSYGADYKLAIWAAIWGGEEYTHFVVLRRILEAMGEAIPADEYAGVERVESAEWGYTDYYNRLRVAPEMSRRLQTLIYGVIQEYAAVIAYSAVGEASGHPDVDRLLKRVARDEMRHCQFFQRTLEAAARHAPAAERALIWPQFAAFFKDFSMPQEFIEIFREKGMGTDLYIKFWTPEHRSRMALFLTHYFRQYRESIPTTEMAVA